MRPGSLFDAPDHFGFAPILADHGREAQWQRRYDTVAGCWHKRSDAQNVAVSNGRQHKLFLLFGKCTSTLPRRTPCAPCACRWWVVHKESCQFWCWPMCGLLQAFGGSIEMRIQANETYSQHSPTGNVNILHSETLNLFCTVSSSQRHQQSASEKIPIAQTSIDL